MGLILKKVALVDYSQKIDLYSKLVRGGLEFFIEPHHLDGGKKLQIYLYRNHPRIKEFIDADKVKHHLTKQISEIKTECNEIRLIVNDKSFMINGNSPTTIKVVEYNFNTQLKDFDKGKVAILIDIEYNKESNNNKAITALRDFNKEEDSNNETTITSDDK